MLAVDKRHRAYLKEVVALAQKIGKYKKRTGDTSDLWWNLTYLRFFADHDRRGITKCVLYPDRPNGFGFVMHVLKGTDWKPWFNGGLLYHGPHDGFGSGAGPTFAVTLNSTDGWSIHAT